MANALAFWRIKYGIARTQQRVRQGASKQPLAPWHPWLRATRHDSHGLAISNDLAACLKGAVAAVLLTEHKAYRSLSSKIFAESMSGRLIADGRNWLNHAYLRSAGFTVLQIGVGNA